MKRIILTASVAVIGMFCFSAYCYRNSDKPKAGSIIEQSAKSTENNTGQGRPNDTTLSNSKLYTDGNLGITFRYPSTWIKNGKDAKVIDLSGTRTATQIDFVDTVSQTSLSITYHLAPHGAELYQYAISQYNSTKGDKKIEVAGAEAIETHATLQMDGRGQILNPPVKLISVYILDRKKTGEIELQFKTLSTYEDIQAPKFSQVLSSFKFN